MVYRGMRYANTPLRPGLTAIAAVFAMSSTPLLAQPIDAAPAAPALVTPPPVETTAPAVTAAPAAAPVSVSKAPAPVSVDLGPDTSASTEPAPAAAAPVARSAPAPRVATAAPRATAPAAEAVAPEAPAPVAAPPVVAQTATPAPIAEPTPAPVSAPAAAPNADTSNDILPLAGTAGAAVLLLAGGAFAFTRRRRDAGVVIYAPAATTAIADPEPMPIATPAPLAGAPMAAAPTAYAAPPMSSRRPEEVVSDVPVTAIPAGFDLSRYGRHTQAAYRGPTPDNRSLSLRRRLKRANFFDQRERMAAQGTQPGTAYAPAPAAAAATAPRHTEYVTTKAPQQPRPTFRPAYQS